MTSEGHARNVPDARETPGTGRALGSLFSDAHRWDLAISVACDVTTSRRHAIRSHRPASVQRWSSCSDCSGSPQSANPWTRADTHCRE